ncbi:MAG: ribosome assembly RNA-binding protein YhbY [Oscillospiraceae bacterium]|nr:ribosome assembly RNA-binding protein YhbY [Oscillospiraceae bacterium]
MKINSKQRAYLRGLANSYDTIFQIGKGGINENMTAQISDALEARELIKLRILKNCEMTTDEAAEAIAEAVGAEIVQVIGTRFILYRESVKHKKIELI